jgi:hypothetical protein
MTEEEIMRLIDESIAEFQASLHKKVHMLAHKGGDSEED